MVKADYRRFYKVTAAASGGGTASITPASADGYYPENSTVTMSATPAPGYCFSGWTGLLGGTPASVPLLVSKEYAVNANFVPNLIRISRVADWFPAVGGRTDIDVATAGCQYNVATDAAWIHATKAATTVGISVDPNRTLMHRMAFVRIGTTPYLIVQSAF
jgi:hypothetical protein